MPYSKKGVKKEESKTPKKMGRPRKNIDKEAFENLCKIQCTLEEICAVLDVSHKTLEAWCKREYNTTFSHVFTLKRNGGKASLRRTQFQIAEKGNPTMAIWLGKQYLGQKDTPDIVEATTIEEDDLSKSLRELGEGL